MPALQVKDVPNDLYDRIEEAARIEDRSIGEETLVILKKGLDHIDAVRAEHLERIFKEIDEIPIKNPDTFPSPESMVREDRDR
jgi:hypothetical protein